jgi:hypothetical protein
MGLMGSVKQDGGAEQVMYKMGEVVVLDGCPGICE